VQAEDEQSDRVACVVTHGQPAKADTALPVLYEDCELISNLCNVRFGDYYGKGSNHRFVRYQLRRTGNDQRYHTFITDGTYWSKRHVLLDCDFGAGTAWDDVLWKQTGWQSDYSVQWTLRLTTVPNAAVRIVGATGTVAFAGVAAPSGVLEMPLAQCRVHPPRKLTCPTTEKVVESQTPHMVTVTADGVNKEAAVTMSSRKELVLR
jgi:hypothetical protein